MGSRRSGPVSHLTPAQQHQYFAYQKTKSSRQPSPVPQKPSAAQFLRPLIYHPSSSNWVAPEDDSRQSLKSGSLLKVVSWNVDWSTAGAEVRAAAALEHLRGLFGEVEDPFVVMFQEVCQESLQVILENRWVQRNFMLSNTQAPESLYSNIPGHSFIVRQLDWKSAPYFSLLMISRNLAIESCFRVPFVTKMGRDALVVDIPILSSGEQTESKECLRLCTTHLESLWSGKAYRPGQLGLISTLLKGSPTMKSRIAAGLVGGDMNAIDRLEHDFHRAINVELQDAWEDVPSPSIPILKPAQKDLSYGRARGNTWGYQPCQAWEPKRMDKFLYTGPLKTVALDEAQDVMGRLGRLGIGLKTDPGRTGVNSWVSDHFGIAIGVKVLSERLSIT